MWVSAWRSRCQTAGESTMICRHPAHRPRAATLGADRDILSETNPIPQIIFGSGMSGNSKPTDMVMVRSPKPLCRIFRHATAVTCPGSDMASRTNNNHEGASEPPGEMADLQVSCQSARLTAIFKSSSDRRIEHGFYWPPPATHLSPHCESRQLGHRE